METERTHLPFARFSSQGTGVIRDEGKMEHRWGHRREISRPVHVGTRGGVLARGRICNVSISGAFVITPLPVTLFSHVQLQFTAMVAGERRSTALEGQVVRKDSTGFGIEWSEFAPEAARALLMVPAFRATEPPHPAWEPEQAKVSPRGRRFL
jgi:PilZ domain